MKVMKKIAGICLSAVILFGCVPVWGAEAKAEQNKGVTYYIDRDGGNDSNSGTDPKNAWSSLEKVNATTFRPGDKILFQKGDVWNGQLSPKGSGTKEAPIVIGDYGDAEARPMIQGNNWCKDKGDDLENKIFNAADRKSVV